MKEVCLLEVTADLQISRDMRFGFNQRHACAICIINQGSKNALCEPSHPKGRHLLILPLSLSLQ